MRSQQLLRAARQAGFTLVELMVAVAIALFLLAAVLNIYLNMKGTFNAQSDMAQLQDSERLALTMLTTTVQSAGYFVDPTTDTRASALPVQAAVTRADGSTYAFDAGQSIVGTSGTGSGALSDTVTIRYQTQNGDGLMNCQGGTLASGTTAVSTNGFAVNNKNELTCAIDAGAAVPLASNVNTFSVRYGVDTDGNGDVDTYMPASGVTAAGLWGSVYLAQVTLGFQQKKVDGAVVPVNVVQLINLMNNK